MQQLAYFRGRGRVKLVDQFPLYELGAALHELKELCKRDVTEPIEQVYGLWIARKQLVAVLDGEQPLHFCRMAANELLRDMEEKERHLSSTSEDGRPVGPLKRWQMNSIATKIDVFEHQLSGELKKTATYAVPERGIFNIELLAEGAERHIHESIRVKLPKFARDEFRAAGRCLAFGMYSASGFHAARAVETVLRDYYKRFIGLPPDKPMGLLASNLADLLEKKDAVLKPKENTVRHIKDVTNFDRNPLMHRGVDLQEIDALTLFNSALAVMVEMTKELAEIEDKEETASLFLEEVPFDLAPPKPAKSISAPKKKPSS